MFRMPSDKEMGEVMFAEAAKTAVSPESGHPVAGDQFCRSFQLPPSPVQVYVSAGNIWHDEMIKEDKAKIFFRIRLSLVAFLVAVMAFVLTSFLHVSE